MVALELLPGRARKALIVSSRAASMRIKISEGQNVEELDR
jgi:hypothetical protein